VLARMDQSLDLSRLQSMRQVLNHSLASQRFLLLLLGGLALGATLLAALGIYGVISHLVAQRTRELGVRMALGAQRRDVLGLVLRHGTFLLLGGLTLGLAGALATTRVLSGLLHKVSPLDPLTFLAVPALLAGVGLLACFIPARRAARIEPMEALRHE
jgi:putative ABC transport system permease protein